MSNRLISGWVLVLLSVVGSNVNGQLMKADSSDMPALEWLVMDPIQDKMQGVSANKTYAKLLKDRPSKKVVVAVIDSGVDIDHEDLQGKIWINTDEIEGNGIDDDKNGYVDDRYGWNFIGGKDGNVEQDTYELTRIYKELRAKYEGIDEKKVKKKNKDEYEFWLKVKKDFEPTRLKAQQQYDFYSNLQKNVVRFHTLLKAYLDVDTLTMDNLRTIESQDST
ncbi:MAG: S8 family serine peptidase, partial [Bacteroidota bacterium]